jgi:putative transposase
MRKYKKLSHVIYYHEYHIVWTPKYRFKILEGPLKVFVEGSIRSICEWKHVEIVEMNVQKDHIHVVVSIPPKMSVSRFMGMVKGKTAIKVFKSFPVLKKKPYWGNHFWSRGYCSSTIGLDEEKIKKYVKYQEEHEKQVDKQQLGIDF